MESTPFSFLKAPNQRRYNSEEERERGGVGSIPAASIYGESPRPGAFPYERDVPVAYRPTGIEVRIPKCVTPKKSKTASTARRTSRPRMICLNGGAIGTLGRDKTHPMKPMNAMTIMSAINILGTWIRNNWIARNHQSGENH